MSLLAVFRTATLARLWRRAERTVASDEGCGRLIQMEVMAISEAPFHLIQGASLSLALAYAWAGGYKLTHRAAFRTTISMVGVPRRAAGLLSIVIPVLECATAVGLLSPWRRLFGVVAGCIAMGVLTFGVRSSRLPFAVPCNCFDAIEEGDAFTTIRATLLLGFACLISATQEVNSRPPSIGGLGVTAALLCMYLCLDAGYAHLAFAWRRSGWFSAREDA